MSFHFLFSKAKQVNTFYKEIYKTNIGSSNLPQIQIAWDRNPNWKTVLISSTDVERPTPTVGDTFRWKSR